MDLCCVWLSLLGSWVFLSVMTACSGLPLIAEGGGALKTGLPRPPPFPLPALFDFPVGGISDVRLEREKILCDKVSFLKGYLYALSPSRDRYKHVLHTFKDRFIRFSCVICSFYSVCVRYLYGSYATRPLFVLYTFGSRMVIVRFMRFILRSRGPPGARILIFTTGNNGCFNSHFLLSTRRPLELSGNVWPFLYCMQII